jgi:hypothetical protein
MWLEMNGGHGNPGKHEPVQNIEKRLDPAATGAAFYINDSDSDSASASDSESESDSASASDSESESESASASAN